MEITFLGHASFKIRGKGVTIITDPYDDSVGMKFPKLDANIVLVSHEHPDHNNYKAILGEPKLISGPGEYEVKGISIFGIPSYHDEKQGGERGRNTIYTFKIEGVSVCHLGDLGHKLTQDQLAEIGTTDVLMIPVGGVYSLDAEMAVEAVANIEPKIILPMHFAAENLSYKLDSLDKFVKEIGMEPTPLDKLVVTADKLPEERQLIVLEAKD